MTYTDPRSKHQIALYKTHEIFAAREWNMKNANRWNEHLRSQWELMHVKPKSSSEQWPKP